MTHWIKIKKQVRIDLNKLDIPTAVCGNRHKTLQGIFIWLLPIFLSAIRYVQKRSLFNKSCYRGCLRDVNDKSPGVQFAMFVGNDNRCLLSI